MASNSIASMKKANPAPSKESLALKSAFEQAKMSQAAVAKHLNVSPGMVWQWIEGARPVAARYAKKLGELLAVEPARISEAYSEIMQQDGSGNVVSIRKASTDERRPDLIARRLENDVDALRFALGAIVSTMVAHRPAEATAVGKALRGSVPARFLDRGFLYELLAVLDKAGKV